MSNSFIRDANGAMVDASKVRLPSNRDFRRSWVHTGRVVEVDMDKAKVELRSKMTEAVKSQLRENFMDQFIDATLMKDVRKLAELRTLRNLAKQVDSDVSINEAATPEDLVRVWDKHVDTLGPNPYRS